MSTFLDWCKLVHLMQKNVFFAKKKEQKNVRK